MLAFKSLRIKTLSSTVCPPVKKVSPPSSSQKGAEQRLFPPPLHPTPPSSQWETSIFRQTTAFTHWRGGGVEVDGVFLWTSIFLSKKNKQNIWHDGLQLKYHAYYFSGYKRNPPPRQPPPPAFPQFPSPRTFLRYFKPTALPSCHPIGQRGTGLGSRAFYWPALLDQGGQGPPLIG